MPFTHIEIQKERQWKSILLFSLLVFYYFFSFVLLGETIRLFLFFMDADAKTFSPLLTLKEVGICLVTALIVAIFHWLYAIANGVERILKSLHAQSPEPSDRYHNQFMNVIEEIRIATGGRIVRPVIIPTLAANAFAISTNESNAVIGVTEGLLARLNRSQLECVVGHEMAHILNNDCILVTIACSLFATFAQLLQLSVAGAKETARIEPWIFVGIIGILTLGAKLLNVSVDRQREYLADATAVRLTRNPTSMAEALMKLSNSWRGIGYMDDSMAPIFILNPRDNLLDEKVSFFSNLFSTHPPIRKRLDVLLELAHTDFNTVAQSVVNQKQIKEDSKSLDTSESTSPWWVKKDNNWQGPFTLGQMQTLDFLKPGSWISQDKGKQVMMAYEEPALFDIFRSQLTGNLISTSNCPRCRQSLILKDYEGSQVHYCNFCQGYLIEEENIFRILSRREIGFSDEFKDRVKRFQDQSLRLAVRQIRPVQQDSSKIIQCPKCNAQMNRTFYSYQYCVIVDRCYVCKLIWFDKDELQILQVLIEGSSVG